MLKNRKLIYIAVFGLITSVSAFFISNNLESKRLKTIFEKDASDRIRLVLNSIEMTELVVESLHNLFKSSEQVSQKSFHNFVKSYSKKINGTKSIGWAPKVSSASQTNSNNHNNKQISPNSDLEQYDEKDYFPIYYFEPVEYINWIGYDLASSRPVSEAIKNSIEYNRAIVTKKEDYNREDKNNLGILILQPVLKSNSTELLGFVFCVFEPEKFIDNSLGMLQNVGIDIYLNDESAKDENKLLYYHNSQSTKEENISSETNEIYLKKQFLFGGRVWSVTCIPTDTFFKNNYSIVSKTIFLIFLSISAFFVYYYYRNSSEKQKINKLVDLRTKELNESTERLNLALKSADLGMWDWNITTGDIFFNERWSTMLGYNSTEIEPCIESWKKLLHPDDKKEACKILDKHLNGEIPIYTSEYRLLTKSGKWKWILDAGKVVERDNKGKALRATGIHMDISERKTIQQKILAYNNKLEKTNQDNNKLFSIIGHDLKSPLAAIKGFSDFLTNELDELNEKEIREYSKYIYDSSSSLFEMLEGLLDWGRMKMGSIQHDPSNYSLSKQIERVLSHYVVISVNKKIKIHSNFNDNIEVFADEVMIETVLRNLISNALKFTPSYGNITISVSQYEVSSLLISISDTGIGIEENAFNSLFKSSFHSSTNGTDGEKGTGLGLSLCKEFVEMNNGQIWAESEENVGTTFHFTLNTSEGKIIQPKEKIIFQN